MSTSDAIRILQSSGAFSSYLGYTTSLGTCIDYTPPASSRSATDLIAGVSVIAYGVTDRVCEDQERIQRRACDLYNDAQARVGILSVVVLPDCPKLVSATASGVGGSPEFSPGDSITLLFDKNTGMQDISFSSTGAAVFNTSSESGSSFSSQLTDDIIEFDPPLPGRHVSFWAS